MKFAKFSILSLSLVPFFAFAQGFEIQGIIDKIATAVDSLVPVLMTLALVVFFWGLVKYIKSASDPKAASEGKSIMIWGIIALFVMSAVWGLTASLEGALGLDNGEAPSASQLTPKP